MRIWRVTKRRHVESAFRGEGAARREGRWHKRGSRVVYASGTLALAMLEVLVHVDRDDAPESWVCVGAELPDDTKIEKVEKDALPRGWRTANPYSAETQDIGARWLEGGKFAALSVPSAIIPIHEEKNYLLNPDHGEMKRIEIVETAPFTFDPRLFK